MPESTNDQAGSALSDSLIAAKERFLADPLIAARELAAEQHLSIDQVRSLFAQMRLDPESQSRLDSWGPADGYCARSMKHLLEAPHVLERFLAGEPVYPFALELHLGPACSCACVFCYSKGESTIASGCAEYRPPAGARPLPSKKILSIISALVDNGCEEIYFSGGLEPFSASTTVEVLRRLPRGPKVRIYTNGVPDTLNGDVLKLAVGRAAQIRFSIHAATPETYGAVQMPHRKDAREVFPIVVRRVREAMGIQKTILGSGRPAAQIGVTFLTVPGNYAEIEQAADMWAQVGVDFFDIGNDALSEEPRTAGLSADQRVRLGESFARLKHLSASGAFGRMVVRPSREDVQKAGLRGVGNCYVPLFKAVIDLFGYRWTCCMRAHPTLQHGKFRIGPAMRSGADFVRFAEQQARAAQSSRELPLPWHCRECTEFEYVANICAEKLLDDLRSGIKPGEQPFIASSVTRPRIEA